MIYNAWALLDALTALSLAYLIVLVLWVGLDRIVFRVATLGVWA